MYAKGHAPNSRATQFKPGHPSPGKPPLPPELKAISLVTAPELARIISKYLRKNIKDVEIVANAKLPSEASTPSLDSTLCKILLKAHHNGDEKKLEFLLHRAGIKITINEGEINNNDDLAGTLSRDDIMRALAALEEPKVA